MTLVALFPLPSTRNDSACNLVEEDKEDEEEYCQTRDQIQFVSASNLKANMTTESNPYGMESSTSCLEQCNAMGEAEGNSFDRDGLGGFYSNTGCKSRESMMQRIHLIGRQLDMQMLPI